MNPLKPLEERLRSWSPRRPSARLENRLFDCGGAGRREERSGGATYWGWYWLAPATAIVLVLGLSMDGWRHQAGYRAGTGTRLPLTTLALSNQSPVAWVTSPDAYDRNSPPSGTFEWTNTQGTPSSTGPFLLFKTNRLNR